MYNKGGQKVGTGNADGKAKDRDNRERFITPPAPENKFE
jgi:hypothetical protein